MSSGGTACCQTRTALLAHREAENQAEGEERLEQGSFGHDPGGVEIKNSFSKALEAVKKDLAVEVKTPGSGLSPAMAVMNPHLNADPEQKKEPLRSPFPEVSTIFSCTLCKAAHLQPMQLL